MNSPTSDGKATLSLDSAFDRIFVINLARRTDRRQDMLKQFNRYLNATNFEFFDAFDGYDVDVDDLYTKGILLDKELGIGEIACFLSHREVWKIAAQRGYESVLILEDDIRFNSWLQSIVVAKQHVPEDWDIIHFHSNFYPQPERVKINDHIYRGQNEGGGCACYALSNVGYIKLICNSAVIPFAVDGITALLSQKDDHKAYVSDNVCYVDVAAGSDITEMGRKY